MAFMLPVVKNDFNLYPSCPSSKSSSRCSSKAQSRASSLSTSPRGSNMASFISSPRSSQSPAVIPTPNCGSQSSLNNFHNKLVDKLRKVFRKGDSDAVPA